MKCSWVLPNLAIGSDPRADQEFQELKLLQITAILSLQTDEDRGVGGIEGELAAAHKAGLAISSVSIEDFNRAELRAGSTRKRGRTRTVAQTGKHRVRSLHGCSP